MRGIGLLFKIAWGTFVLLTPLLGVWASSSLTAYFGGPTWAALGAGALLFPILPLAWESRARRRREKKRAARGVTGPDKRLMTLGDRVVMRTLLVNLAFLTGLVAGFPQATFPALAKRGDWFLDGRSGASVERARLVVFAAAGRLEWLYRLTYPNPYADLGEDDASDDDPPPPPPPRPTPTPTPDVPPPDVPTPDVPTPDVPTPDVPTPPPPPADDVGTWQIGEVSWPMKAELHPVIVAMPKSAETSIAAVGKYIAARETDPVQRVKALHDWVADRIYYDHPGIADGSYPRLQAAQTVFKRRAGVCAGYANLLVALGKVTGDKIRWIPGHSRDPDGSVDGAGHAWNAVEIKGTWYLLDATWNSARSLAGGGGGPQQYETTYLFTPPTIFSVNHLPEKPRWQLRRDPITRVEFLRQPLLQPTFFAEGLTLKTPTSARVEASGTIRFALDNPRGRYVMGVVEDSAGQKVARCKVERGRPLTGVCPLGGAGVRRLKLFTNDQPSGTFGFVGMVEVTSRN